ncbi:ribokinase [Psychrobacillus psychrodurans]|uniref:ribokinase n=1 Tax=Psychrobacillus psychrodurans TaxID=126157 RepID=UPI000B84A1E8|nr:ribokinase [Psychrobacillus psychrodurans]MCK1997548.1 ribokinase [Psychrobacillus psychrodurans]MCZ8540508.1 ribokinase [Psychrobacillus psychrodurans]
MITVIGSVNMDIVVQTDNFPIQGETVLGQLFTTVPGGKGANQAVAAARLGSKVQMVASVGTDSFGKELVENLEKNAVNTNGVIISDGTATGIANILLSEGDNRIIVVPGANHALTLEHIEKMKETIRQSKFVMMQLEIPIPVIEYSLKLCSELNIPVLLNPAPAGGFQKEFMDYIAYLTPNETECEVIFGLDVEAVLEKYPNKLIVTLGSEGARYFDGEKHVIVEGFKTDVVDTTGAGDTFNGALAHALAQGLDLESAVQYANAAASLSVEKFGAQGGMPAHDDVKKRLEGASKS